MKTGPRKIKGIAAILGAIVIAGGGGVRAQQPGAAPAAPGSAKSPAAAAQGTADALWQSIEAEPAQPNPPKEWQTARPSEETVKAWLPTESARLLSLADRARDFAAKYPNDPHAGAARLKEWQALMIAAQIAPNSELMTRLDGLDAALLKDPSLSAQNRFDIRLSQIRRKAQSRDQAEQMARGLLKDFPDNPRAALVLLEIARGSGTEHLRAVAEEVAKGQFPEEAKAAAQKILAKMDRAGKPLALQFTALDGQAVDLGKLKGKVVLIDFWATWCGPCVAEVPNVKAAYEKLHGKGFEILGISFDENKEALTAFLKEKGMTWPQYFDGQGWKNRFAAEFDINSIPAMWLVDKKGVLRDMQARQGLAEKVEKLLAEP